MNLTEQDENLHVLTLGAVRAGIAALQRQYIHEQFPAYLHLRQQAITSGNTASIKPAWHQVGELLKMPGGPPKKPYYRPFSSRNRKDPDRNWLNPNLAGSYAEKSLRSTGRFMLKPTGGGFALPADHASQALTILLQNKKVPAWALSAYYLRNYGFIFEGDGGYNELITAFRKEFQFDNNSDFDIIFEDEEPDSITDGWFEAFTRSNFERQGTLNV